MPNGHGRKEYGQHKYVDHNKASCCIYGCGCWMGPTNSGGPLGLDPDPEGTCPQNPKDGKLLGENDDYYEVVTKRIENLSSRLFKAEDRLKKTSPSKTKLADEISELKKELTKKNQFVDTIRGLISCTH